MSSKEDQLVNASENGDAATVRALLAEGNVDVHARNQYGMTSLHLASRGGHLEVVQLLLDAQANPNIGNQVGHRLIDRSWRSKGLTKGGCVSRIRADQQQGFVPLHWASMYGHPQVVELLLTAGADPNAANLEGKTPLHHACIEHNSDVARELLSSGAELHAKTKKGYGPLHCCLKRNSSIGLKTRTLRTLQVLVSFGAVWDAMCDHMVATGEAWDEAPALRICVLLWAQELTDRVELSEIPHETVGRGVASTQTFIDRLKTSREFVLRRKICLVGSSCAGKTSLVKCITSDAIVTFDEPQLEPLDDRTIGIDHFPHRFEQLVASRNDTKIHEVTFWDFAGQDVYQVAHSLFFSPRALYLVCVDLQAFAIGYMQAAIFADVEIQETKLLDEFVEDAVMRWIRMIVSRQPDAEIVFIATKEDVLSENRVTEQLLKETLLTKLRQVERTIQEIKDRANARSEDNATDGSGISVTVAAREPRIVNVSCTSRTSVNAARDRIEDLIIQSDHSVTMPDTYSRALDTIVAIRQAATTDIIDNRINHVFAPVSTLPAMLNVEPELCKTILQTLHDLGDVLWYEDLGVDLFENTVILDPLLLIDFIRQIFTHKHRGVTMSHHDLKAKPFWRGISCEKQMKAMKQVLQKFHLVYASGKTRIMHWYSDLIVPAFWQTKTPASWKFLGDILRIKRTWSREGEAVRIEWVYHFEYGLPSPLFDQVVVASMSPFVKFEAGPDWIVYEEKKIAACRIMVGRDRKSLHQTILVEAVVAKVATKEQADKLWKSFRHLIGAFVVVLREYPGLKGVSSIAYSGEGDSDGTNLRDLLEYSYNDDAASWMPPAATWAWFQQLVTRLA